jgi:hypothetical protein
MFDVAIEKSLARKIYSIIIVIVKEIEIMKQQQEELVFLDKMIVMSGIFAPNAHINKTIE